jgi:hypothetical protein
MSIRASHQAASSQCLPRSPQPWVWGLVNSPGERVLVKVWYLNVTEVMTVAAMMVVMTILESRVHAMTRMMLPEGLSSRVIMLVLGAYVMKLASCAHCHVECH